MLKKIKNKLFKSSKNTSGRGEMADASAVRGDTPNDTLAMLDEYDRIRKNPGEITGEDFDRAFTFIDKYPDSNQAKHLINEMTGTSGQRLKGLSYESAVKILMQMPDHPGSQSIIRGMYKIEKEYISRLVSDVLMFMLEVAPDHPHADVLTQTIVEKNFTNAYNFITRNPEHLQTRAMIKEMFRRDPNIAILLLQEKMDHPQVDAIIDGVYSINMLDVRKLTPNAIIFVLDIAPDHPLAEKLIKRLVRENYIKAFDFIKEHMEYPNADMMVKAICRRKPELKELF